MELPDSSSPTRAFKRKLLAYSSGRTRDFSELETSLLIDIFSKLPPETVVACQAACKKWDQLTTDPNFIQLQLKRSQNRVLIQAILGKGIKVDVNPLFLVDIENNMLREIPTPRGDIQIMSTSDGILCVRESIKKVDPLLLFNPFNQTRVRLPISQPKRVFSSYVVAFGYDHRSEKYKVVRHYRFERGRKESRLETLTLGDGSWKRINCPIPNGHAYQALYYRGWFFLQFILKQPGNTIWSIYIIGIDSSENFLVLLFPKYFESRPFVEMVEIGGFLNFLEHDKYHVQRWILGRNTNTGVFSIQLIDTLYTAIRWSRGVYFETIHQQADNTFLQRITTWKGDADRISQFTPGAAGWFSCDLEIANLPFHFKAFSFIPSFINLAAVSSS